MTDQELWLERLSNSKMSVKNQSYCLYVKFSIYGLRAVEAVWKVSSYRVIEFDNLRVLEAVA